jgi:DNA polymerase (family 10)
MSLNTEVSNLFQTLAGVLQIKGAPVFKTIAFEKVARLLEESSIDIRKAIAEDRLKDIPGVGPTSRLIIEQYAATGHSDNVEEAIGDMPRGLIPMLQIPGLGPKTIQLLWKERGIESVEQLSKAIEEGKLAGLKGVGEKKIEAIKQGIALRAAAGERMGIVQATKIAGELLAAVRDIAGVDQAEIAGSLRRRKETIGDVDLICSLVAGVEGSRVSKAFTELPGVDRVLGQGTTKASILTNAGLQVDLRIVPAVNFGAALQYFTGSKEHNVKLRALAQNKGMTLNEWGLYRLAEYNKAEKKTAEAPDAKPVASRTEAEIYAALGLATPEPEIREDRGEIEAAAAGKLPKLIELSDIRGDLHCHTTASDGEDSILAMAEAAKKLGYEFLAITDHSKAQTIANGLSAERLLAHVKEIHRIGSQLKGITLLAGCEVDILPDGTMDFEDEILAELDWVIGSPHLALKQEPDKATDRLLRAIDNPYVNLIGHPTGRLIARRAGLPLDLPRIIHAAAANGTALEINAAYPRLDLNDVNSRAAIAGGVKLSINTDAHSIGGFLAMPFGIDVARRAWARREDVINCMSLKSLREFIKKKRP